jgi:hypothetical protein
MKSAPPAHVQCAMFKWLLVFVVCSVLFSALISVLKPWLRRLGVGSMPGDFRFRLGKNEVLLPLGSTLFFTLLFWAIGRLIL